MLASSIGANRQSLDRLAELAREAANDVRRNGIFVAGSAATGDAVADLLSATRADPDVLVPPTNAPREPQTLLDLLADANSTVGTDPDGLTNGSLDTPTTADPVRPPSGRPDASVDQSQGSKGGTMHGETQNGTILPLDAEVLTRIATRLESPPEVQARVLNLIERLGSQTAQPTLQTWNAARAMRYAFDSPLPTVEFVRAFRLLYVEYRREIILRMQGDLARNGDNP